MSMLGKKSDPVVAPLVWSSLTEHISKLIFFSSCLTWVVRSSETTDSVGFVIKSCMIIFLLWMIHTELDFLFQRLNRRLPPGVVGMPVIRDIYGIYQLFTSGVSGLLDLRRKHGSMFVTPLLGRTNIVLGGQEDLQWQFMNDRKALTKVSWPPHFRMLLGPGSVANQSGKYHRVLRRLLEPYFLPRFVTNYLKAMDETTMDDLERWCSTGGFVSSEIFKMYALRLFYASSFGSVNEVKIKELKQDLTTWLRGFMSPFTASFPGNPFTEGMKARERILENIDALIDDFQRDNPEDSERAQTTIIGRLVYGRDEDNNNRIMTREETKDNILTLMIAGHETIYASISTLLHHLSQNRVAMDALAREVSTLKEPLDANDLKNAPVLNACIHEAWRVDPPAPGSFRKAVEDLEYKGYSFKKGTVFNYSITMATKDENVYIAPSEFCMERFLPRDHPLHKPEIAASGIDPFQGRSTYPIFGGGTHACLGKAFAQLELRVLVARMMKHYTVEVRNSQKVHFPTNGWAVEFKLTRRRSNATVTESVCI